MLLAKDRGFQKINKRKLADIRRGGAQRGGKVCAGNGTTADRLEAKKRRIITWARKHGFPLSVPQGGSTKVWSLQWPMDSFEDGLAKMRHFNVSSFDFPHDAKSFISLGHVALQRKSCLVPCTLSNRRRFLSCLCWQCSNSALDFITVSKNCKRRQTNDQLVFSCGLSVILMGSCLNKSSNHYTPAMCNHYLRRSRHPLYH